MIAGKSKRLRGAAHPELERKLVEWSGSKMYDMQTFQYEEKLSKRQNSLLVSSMFWTLSVVLDGCGNLKNAMVYLPM